MYTANIVDTVMFRSVGKYPNPHMESLKRAVQTAGTELWVPATIYRELADYGTDPPGNPYLDTGIEEGWVRVATPLSGSRSDTVAQVEYVDPNAGIVRSPPRVRQA